MHQSTVKKELLKQSTTSYLAFFALLAAVIIGTLSSTLKSSSNYSYLENELGNSLDDYINSRFIKGQNMSKADDENLIEKIYSYQKRKSPNAKFPNLPINSYQVGSSLLEKLKTKFNLEGHTLVWTHILVKKKFEDLRKSTNLTGCHRDESFRLGFNRKRLYLSVGESCLDLCEDHGSSGVRAIYACTDCQQLCSPFIFNPFYYYHIAGRGSVGVALDFIPDTPLERVKHNIFQNNLRTVFYVGNFASKVIAPVFKLLGFPNNRMLNLGEFAHLGTNLRYRFLTIMKDTYP